MATILIVEDEALLGRSLAASLGDDGHRATWVSSGEEALDWLNLHNADLALVDCRLPGMTGPQFLDQLVKASPDTVTIMMTAHADVQTAVRCMKTGAEDFLLKPLDLNAISVVAKKSLENRRMARRISHERKARSQRFGLHQIIGQCPGIERAKAIVRRLSTLRVADGERPPNVLISGPTGTGKDLIAQAIHYEGELRDGPFIHVNAAALPEKLVESELFGFVKGAFTGAGASKRGLFEVADGGTLFLDEIGALDLTLQAKVLTAIETGRIRPLGAAEETSINVRLVAAMNQDPKQWVEEGKFRADLYHRLCVVHITMPALRERGRDIDVLADHFLRAYCRKFQLPDKKFTPEARQALRQFDWPGNVRELSHCVESAVLMSGEFIEEDLFPRRRSKPLRSAEGSEGDAISVDFSRGPISLEQVERELITRALAASKHNVSLAAQMLSISRDTLRYRLEKYGMNGQNGDKTARAVRT